MVIYASSDLHGYLPEVPECDLFILAGDFCPVEMSHDVVTQSVWLDKVFKNWVNNEVHADYVVIIGGNHDFVCELPDFKTWFFDNINAYYLENSSVRINDLNIYGTPYVPNLRNWAFYGTKNQLTSHFALIPNDTDILVTHGPPLGVNDGVSLYEHVGSEELADQLEYFSNSGRSIPINIHGHIHEGYGYKEKWGTKFYNVSHCNRDYQPVNKPVEIEV